MSTEKVRLTLEIANEYRKKAKRLSDVSGCHMEEFRKLKNKLMTQCEVTELEALNILRGYHIVDYVRKYEIMNGKITIPGDTIKRKENRELLFKIAELEDEIRTAAMANEGLYK